LNLQQNPEALDAIALSNLKGMEGLKNDQID
jgi:hypothetical protein